MKSREAEFVVVYGRRRVGKTFLVNTFFSDCYTFKLTGLAKKSKREQLANFTASLNRYGVSLAASRLSAKAGKCDALSILFWSHPMD